jgi:hypothetical protein
MRLLHGIPVDPDAAGCCVGLIGAGDTYAACATVPTFSGIITSPETAEVLWAFACERHLSVLGSPRELTAADVAELDRRLVSKGDADR